MRLVDLLLTEAIAIGVFVLGIVWIMFDAAFHGPGIFHLAVFALVSAWLLVALCVGSVVAIARPLIAIPGRRATQTSHRSAAD
jgi:hypothetical protein